MPAYGEPLSERELDVLRQVAAGASNREIADSLIISPNTVKVHLRNIYTKLGVTSRTEAATVALQQRLLTLSDLDEEAAPDGTAAAATPDAPVETTAAVAEAAPENEPDRPAAGRSRLWTPAAVALLILTTVAAMFLLRGQPNGGDADTVQLTPAPTDQPIADSNWFISQPLPQPRAAAAIAAIGLDLYLIGGRTNDGVVAAVDIFETNNRRWHAGAAKPTAVAESSAAVLFGQIYVPGGRLENDQPTAVVEAYSPVNDAWQLAADLPTPVYGALALSDGQLLYVVGGFAASGVTDAGFVFDPGTNSWRPLPPMPTARGYAAGGIINGQLFVVGGSDGREPLAVCERYDPGTTAWTSCPALLQARQAAGATVIPNRLYVLGGQLGPGAGETADVIFGEFYDPTSDTWQLVNLPELVAEADWTQLGLASIEQRIFILGGRIGDELTDQNLVFLPLPFQSFIPAASSNR